MKIASGNSLVSIIAPAYNASNYIEDFILSIIGQEYIYWELLIVDDGSTDNTIEIIKKYSSVDKRIKIIQREREPKGSVTCRNIGQELAKGKYIIHFDADDIVRNYCLLQRVAFMEANADVDYATFKGVSVVERDGKFVFAGRNWGQPTDKDLLKSFLEANYPFSVWNNIYRAEIFKGLLWDEKVKIYTDFSYIVPIIIKGYEHRFCSDGKVDYLYRTGINTAMTSNFISEDKYESTKYLFTKTLNQLKGFQNEKYYKNCFKKFYILHARRVFHDGSKEQIIDFYSYCLNAYKEDSNIRLKMAKTLLGSIKRDSKLYAKTVNGIFMLLYTPKIFFKTVLSKAGVKRK